MSVDDTGSGSITDFETLHGRDFPNIRQFTVFLENRVGQLLGILRRFEGSDVRIAALNIQDSTECCIVRFILSRPEQGREILERAGLAMIECDLVAVELPEGDSPLLAVCSALLRAEVNLVQTYPLMLRRSESTCVALMVDNTEIAQQVLRDHQIRLITENELLDMC